MKQLLVAGKGCVWLGGEKKRKKIVAQAEVARKNYANFKVVLVLML